MKRLIHIVIIVLLSSRAVAITNSEAIQLVNRYYQMLTNYASIDNDSPELARRISSMHIDNTGYIYPDIEIKLGGLPETNGVIISTYLTSLSDPERKRNMLLKFVPKEMNVKSNSGNTCMISYTLYVYDDNVNPNTSVLRYSVPLEMRIYQNGKIKEIVKGQTNTYATVPSSAKINNVWVENNASENGQVGIRIHISMSIYNLISKQCEAAAYFYTASGVALDDKNNNYCTMNGKVSCGKTFTPMYDNTLFKDFTMFMPYEELHTSGGKYKFHVILWDKSASTASELVRSDWVEFIYTYSRVAMIEKVWVDYGASENGVDGMMIHIKMTTYNLKSKQCEAAAYFYTASGVALDDKNNKYCTVNGKVSCGKTFTPTYDNTLFEDFTMFMPYSELHITQDGEYNFFVSIWDKSVSPNKELTQSNRSKFTYTFGK